MLYGGVNISFPRENGFKEGGDIGCFCFCLVPHKCISQMVLIASHRQGGNDLIAGLGQLHVFAAGGFGKVFAHAAADEFPVGVDHQQLDA